MYVTATVVCVKLLPLWGLEKDSVMLLCTFGLRYKVEHVGVETTCPLRSHFRIVLAAGSVPEAVFRIALCE